MMRIVEAGIAEGEPGTYALTIHGDKESIKEAAALFGKPILIVPDHTRQPKQQPATE